MLYLLIVTSLFYSVPIDGLSIGKGLASESIPKDHQPCRLFSKIGCVNTTAPEDRYTSLSIQLESENPVV
jgi:hypothetical protein